MLKISVLIHYLSDARVPVEVEMARQSSVYKTLMQAQSQLEDGLLVPEFRHVRLDGTTILREAEETTLITRNSEITVEEIGAGDDVVWF